MNQTRETAGAQQGELSPAKKALLAKWLRDRPKSEDNGLNGTIPRRADGHRALGLSFEQQRFWFFYQLAPKSPMYNMPIGARLKGTLDPEALHHALNVVVERHEILRTRLVGEEPQAVIDPPRPIEFTQIDLRHLARAERESKALRILTAEATRPFDLAKDLMMRATLVRLEEDEWIYLLLQHHIASDDWSWRILCDEVEEVYKASLDGRKPKLPELPIQYADFAAWQSEMLRGANLENLLAYWRKKLEGAPHVIDLPTDHPRPATQTFRGACEWSELPRPLTDRLAALSERAGATPYMILLAVFQALLHRYTGQDDFLLASAAAGRTNGSVQKIIGLFVNTLVLRANLAGASTFNDLLRSVQATVLEALEHQGLPFERLVQELEPERSASLPPLVQVMFALQDELSDTLRLPGLSVSAYQIDTGASKFDLTLTIIQGSKNAAWNCCVEYNTDLFEASTIRQVLCHFERLLEAVLLNPEKKVPELPILSEEECEQVLVKWNRTETEYPREATIHELFEEQARRAPDAVALVFEGETISYRELNERADAIAHRLRACGVTTDPLVSICAERSPELIIGLLGILKAGGAYVPLDMDYPAERVKQLVADARPVAFLVQGKFLDKVRGLGVEAPIIGFEDEHRTLHVEHRTSNVTAENLAYVLYTSGSTGEPKGVAVPHRAVVRLVKNTHFVSITDKDVFLAFAPISFDASTFEIWGPLLNGGKLVVFPPREASLDELGHVIKDCDVTTLWLTSGLFDQMVEHQIESLKGVRQLLAGGDVLSVPHVLRALKQLPQTKLINGYGPTENTTFTACYEIPRDWDGKRPVPIGKPISNTTVYVLDQNMQTVPRGVVGMLFAGGDGLARGYLNAPEMTAARFVPNPFGAGRLYRTGDLVRYLADGTLEFVGRADDQVKIRGFRIELGEIETRMAAHPKISAAVVLARGDMPGGKTLVGYYVAAETIQSEELRQFLGEKLPAFMVPNYFVRVQKMPLTANGKIDRAKLPAPQVEATEFVAPRNETEETLAGIWRDVMKRDQVGREDNFFDIGGHSLIAMKVLSRAREAFTANLTIRDIFESPTIAGLASVIAAKGGQSTLGTISHSNTAAY
jgi:amino acid adenylation domain-containing protein